ncbi:MAG: carboxypeptidase regulatory-like domain-containing protein [Terracidiphilus sp.]
MAVLAVILFGLQGIPASAQQQTGSLSGIVVDQTGARIPNAKIELKNEASGEARATVSDKEGYFNISAIQPATYELFVSASGFAKWEAKGVVIGLGDQRSIPNITLKVSANGTESITVVSGEDVVVPLDTAEVSTTLNENVINDFPLGGRDAGELLKIMPGFGRTNGISQAASFNSTGAVSSNSGPAGDYSSNGTQPNGTMAFMLDGSNLIDPGNMGTQVANINQDMVSEVKVLTSSYSAEYAKGPVIFEAFSKSGTSHYHGEAYGYARNSKFNSWDWYTKETYLSQGGGSALAAQLRPKEKYYYLGGNVGGPVILPHILPNFNKAHDKLFFWVGYEYMNQHPAAAPIAMNVPTVAQLAGDFSNTTSGAGVDGVTYTPNTMSGLTGGANGYAYDGMWNSPDPKGNSYLRQAYWDPNIVGLINEGAYPTFNVVPSAQNSWNNYVYASSSPQNRYELTGKVSYDYSENTKLNVSYARQVEKDLHPLSIWWAPNWTVPYPSPITANEVGNFIMGNLTHVFTPTTTNELVFNYSRWINPSTLSDPAKVDRTALGFNVGSIFAGNGKTVSPQVPNVEGPWGGALSNIDEESFYSGFDGGKGFGGIKLGQAIYDNFTKIIGTHSLKAGAYWDYEGNQQSGGAANNGTYNIGWGADQTGNLVGDMLAGRLGNYQESSADPTSQVGFHQWSIYLQDSWKANKQLTLNYGVRADHEGQWSGGVENGNFWWGSSGNHNVGYQVWNMSTFVNQPSNGSVANPGLEWNAIDKSIPLSGFPTKFLTYNPRVGFAYDIMGDGKTVLRGGYSVFQYQISTQVNNAWSGPQGSFTYTANGANYYPNHSSKIAMYQPGAQEEGYAGIADVVPPGGTTENGSSVYAIQQGDNRNPYTADWNITISRSLPWRSVFEVSYVGNESKNLYQDGSNSSIGDMNLIKPGAIFLPDPTETGMIYNPANGTLNSANSNPPILNGVAFDGRRSPSGPNCTIGGSSNLVATSNSNSTYCAKDETHYSGNLPAYNTWDWAPYSTYQHMYVMSHSGYANYNALQANWQKQSGPVLWVVNYTFGKVMGIWDYMSSNGASSGPNVDTFSLKNNYGPLAYDHSQIINLSYIWNMPNFVKTGPLAIREVVNGWQISGYTSYQSGVPLQPNTNGNFNAAYPGNLVVPYNDLPLAQMPAGYQQDSSIPLSNGLVATSMNTSSWYGTPSQRIIAPVVTCDPRKGLAKGQYFNDQCFAPPAYGQTGTLVEPYIHAPAYFDSDLAVYKSFKITGNQSFQLRVSATNFLNHPLKEFDASGGNNDVNLQFYNTTQCSVGPGTKDCQLIPNVDHSNADTHTLQTLSQTNTNASTNGRPLAKAGNRSILFSAKYYF